jgi:uncharacterized metal-binding protein YceD (DUF177 family)
MTEDYIIKFTSLKDGFHNFSYKIENKFFEHIEYSETKEAELVVDLSLEKKSTMMILNFEIKGKIKVMCDRCTDDFFTEIESYDELIYRFGTEELGDEKVIVIYPKEIEIDITHPIYEFISLALPIKRLHDDENDCNKDMIEDISKYLLTEEPIESNVSNRIEENETTDPRWSALNKLKNKK